MEAEELPVPETRPEPVRAMNDDAVSSTEDPSSPPTVPSTVVWCGGRPYVLEGRIGRARWMGTDYRGRPESLSSAELQRRGWSHHRAS